jgi:hypothetical protein
MPSVEFPEERPPAPRLPGSHATLGLRCPPPPLDRPRQLSQPSSDLVALLAELCRRWRQQPRDRGGEQAEKLGKKRALVGGNGGWSSGLLLRVLPFALLALLQIDKQQICG